MTRAGERIGRRGSLPGSAAAPPPVQAAGGSSAATRKSGAGKRSGSADHGMQSIMLNLDQALAALWLIRCNRLASRCQREAVLAALLFALHPIHCEAVAGIVGQAELLSAAFALVGLISYIAAARPREVFVIPGVSDRDPRGLNSETEKDLQKQRAGPADGGVSFALPEPEACILPAFVHWSLVFVAVNCCWAAALAKEIGITITGTMVAFDLLLVPSHSSKQQISRDGRWKEASVRSWRRRVARCFILLAVAISYVKMRSWVAGDHLVRIYRKVENPIPFAEDLSTRIMTMGYLHAFYASLLVVPFNLSADWSYACIPYVESVQDPRNILTVALYSTLIWLGISARPWGLIPGILWGGSTYPQARASRRQSDGDHQGTPHTPWFSAVTPKVHEARWRLFVAAGLLVAPFFPASNVLFYVGTFVGERLLYFPSVGYCLLLAFLLDSLGASMSPGASVSPLPLAQDPSPSSPAGSASSASGEGAQAAAADHPIAIVGPGGKLTISTSSKSNTSNLPAAYPTPRPQRGGGGPDSVLGMVKAIACITLVSAVLLAYGVRCTLRNRDWESEETLFTQAGQVCWKSAKVQLNLGILARRKFQWVRALEHFQAARTIEPTYCEPAYWYGLTLVNQGQSMDGGIKELEKAISCKYVAADAVQALNTIYKVMHESSPGDGRHLVSWAKVLLRPEVGRPFEACGILEQAALLSSTGPLINTTRTKAAVNACLKAALPPLNGTSAILPSHLSPSPSAKAIYAEVTSSFARLKECLRARYKVMRAISGSQGGDLKSVQVKAATYNYLQSHADKCRAPALSGPGSGAAAEPNPHMQIVHHVQAADPEDPWLQREWGRILLREGRGKEASAHLEVAGMLFLGQLKLAESGAKLTLLSEAGNETLDRESAARAVLSSLDEALEAGPEDFCRVNFHACEAHLALARMAEGRPDAAAERTRAKDRIRQLYILPSCRQYSRMLSRESRDPPVGLANPGGLSAKPSASARK